MNPRCTPRFSSRGLHAHSASALTSPVPVVRLGGRTLGTPMALLASSLVNSAHGSTPSNTAGMADAGWPSTATVELDVFALPPDSSDSQPADRPATDTTTASPKIAGAGRVTGFPLIGTDRTTSSNPSRRGQHRATHRRGDHAVTPTLEPSSNRLPQSDSVASGITRCETGQGCAESRRVRNAGWGGITCRPRRSNSSGRSGSPIVTTALGHREFSPLRSYSTYDEPMCALSGNHPGALDRFEFRRVTDASHPM